MLKLCVAGAAGRMGKAVIQEAVSKDFQVVGAVEAEGNPSIGKSLRELGFCSNDTAILGSDKLLEAVEEADVYISFTTPLAEMRNIPSVAELGKRIVLGTTGFTEEQNLQLRRSVQGKAPAVFSPNYSVGVNVLFQLAKALKSFTQEYDFSIVEVHHTGKKDAPSGTAKRLAEVVSEIRGYSSIIHGRDGISLRKPGELEIASLRAGGVPGIHDLIVAGPHEILRMEHVAFSRSVFAQGAIFAAVWVSKQNQPEIFSMKDVLGLANKR